MFHGAPPELEFFNRRSGYKQHGPQGVPHQIKGSGLTEMGRPRQRRLEL